MMESLNAPKKRRTQTNPNSLANLRPPWSKGQSGNAKGTPGPKITPRIERMIQLSPAEFFALEFHSVADVIAARYVFESMVSGFDRSSAELIERIDGKVVTRVETEVTRKVETVVIDKQPPVNLRRVK